MNLAMNDKTPGVMILSHCGYSFLEDLAAELKRRQLGCFVLSSLPVPEQMPHRPENIRAWADHFHLTDAHQLQISDVEAFITNLQSRGEQVVACISVWEGYRHLMAYANQRLGVHDLEWNHCLSLRNKLAVRNQLADAQLSQARGIELSPTTLQLLKQDSHRYFIKPIHGIASYGAFALDEDSQWSTLERIRSEAAQDLVYASAFNGELSFMAEHYIAGREYSFEILVLKGDVYVVAVHEKCEITEKANTVLENSCTSPPLSLDRYALAQGIDWVCQVLEQTALNWGCFHIEARFDGKRWDLIEINPRVGGSLISQSVGAQTGHNLLSLWIDLLLVSGQEQGKALAAFGEELSRLAYTSEGISPGEVATFFRVYFAEPGTLEQVTVKALPLDPVITQVLLKAGDRIAEQAREIFLGQLMWSFARASHRRTFETLAPQSAKALDIRYRQQPTASPQALATPPHRLIDA